MQPLFTPGPWRLDDPVHGEVRQPDYHCIDAGRGYLVAGGNGFGIAGFMTIHDARLIAAAPDLLAACESARDLLRAVGRDLDKGGTYEDICRAIARATGVPHGS
jgi:hypothetical protein